MLWQRHGHPLVQVEAHAAEPPEIHHPSVVACYNAEEGWLKWFCLPTRIVAVDHYEVVQSVETSTHHGHYG